MRVSALQRYLLIRAMDAPRGSVPRGAFSGFYAGRSAAPKAKEQANDITRSLEVEEVQAGIHFLGSIIAELQQIRSVGLKRRATKGTKRRGRRTSVIAPESRFHAAPIPR